MLKQFAALVLAGIAFGVSAAQIEFDFSNNKPGDMPPGFINAVTGPGKPGAWKIERLPVPPLMAPLEPGAASHNTERSVLAIQSYNLAPEHSPLLLFSNEIFSDFTFTTRFKISGGIVDPCAGIAFRAQDPSNYYVLRASTEGNLLWYRVINGKSYENLGVGVRLAMDKDVWRELKVVCNGSGIRCFLDGHLAIPPAQPGAPTDGLAINDTTFARGMVGFWTKADTKCYFVDARVEYTPRVPYVQVAINNIARKYPHLLGLKVYADKNAGQPVVIGAMDTKLIGVAGGKVEQDVIDRGSIFYLKESKSVEITLPLRDRNGDIEGALAVKMKTFRGETESTAVSRATIVKKAFEEQVGTLPDINGS